MTHWEGGIFVNKQWFPPLIQQLLNFVYNVYNIMTYIHMDNIRQEMDFEIHAQASREGREGGVREECKEAVAMVYRFLFYSHKAS